MYPTLLDFDAPLLLGYTPETSIAEKFEAMVILDTANTRLKDFLDIWVLAQGREFRGDVLANAIKATFSQRRTPLPQFTPLALTPAFHSVSAKQTQSCAYLRKSRVEGEVPPPLLMSGPAGPNGVLPEHGAPNSDDSDAAWSAMDFNQSPPAERDVGA